VVGLFVLLAGLTERAAASGGPVAATAEEAGRIVGRLLVIAAIIALVVWLIVRGRRRR